ncbi:succinate dehydrogenase, cytochrome b556 subunit [Ehrlichia japonica]|uniref:Succinate dehydrogenase cytochrome b556 subunit n=1 Tax=Ehrlichia japonica TaxID=391036 RepID=X5H0I4_9RICK|nr:succinate dehydrogenase, cytochrome b556 subunit [Ehrlichia japonica]AHX04334.1 succinate dehydrogenase, cytochrome b556 subunit [Ehrlichia japonica]
MSKIRPLSPHLQIYKVVYKLSIMHRFSGIILFLGLLILSWCFIASFLCPQMVYGVYSFLCSSYISLYCFKLLAFVWLNVLCYHYLNGIRHILWDLGFGLTKSAVKITGIVVVCLCLFSSFVLYSFFLS